MNQGHADLCSSAEWAKGLQDDVIAPLFDGAGISGAMLEIGPGPGAATEWLLSRVSHLTALEVDPMAAAALAERLNDERLEVVVGDAGAMTFDDESFDAVASFTMLHHVPTDVGQFRILTEAQRVLRPGGILIGSDSLASNDLHDFHAEDTYNPLEPATLLSWLLALDFERVTVNVDGVLRFLAHRPLAQKKEYQR